MEFPLFLLLDVHAKLRTPCFTPTLPIEHAKTGVFTRIRSYSDVSLMLSKTRWHAIRPKSSCVRWTNGRPLLSVLYSYGKPPHKQWWIWVEPPRWSHVSTVDKGLSTDVFAALCLSLGPERVPEECVRLATSDLQWFRISHLVFVVRSGSIFSRCLFVQDTFWVSSFSFCSRLLRRNIFVIRNIYIYIKLCVVAVIFFTNGKVK